MKPTILFLSCGIVFASAANFGLRADQLEMQNGDRYSGKVLSMSADTVVLQNDVLGKINVPRNKVAHMAFGTNVVAVKASANVASVVPTNLPNVAALTGSVKGKSSVAATGSNLKANSDLAAQIREQMLSGSPEAAGKYNEMITGFMTGKLNVNDIRREAKSSADQLRKLKSELGPEVGDSLDAYLEVLESFLNESGNGAAPASSQPKEPAR